MEKHIQFQSRVDHCMKLFILLLIVLLKTTQSQSSGHGKYIYIHSAVAKGAVCLDGSPPIYSLMKGYGEGSNNWIVYLEGGEWCETAEACLQRSHGYFGSSFQRQNMSAYFQTGYISGNQSFNPEFYNWNRAFLAYCDGASFMGDVEEVDPKTRLHYRGKRVFDAVMEELLKKGLKSAHNAILTGSSAGGLASTLHCDGFQSLLPHCKRVKCLSDSGFFIRAKHLPGSERRDKFFADVVHLHGLAKNLPKACTTKMSPELCFFPENIVGHIKTPIFLIESSFDAWQISVNLRPSPAEQAEWAACTTPKFYFNFCNKKQLNLISEFGRTFRKTLQNLKSNPSRGMYVHTRYFHINGLVKWGWRCSGADDNMLANKTIARAVADWFFDRNPFHVMDTVNTIMPRVDCGDQTDEDFKYLFNKKCFNSSY